MEEQGDTSWAAAPLKLASNRGAGRSRLPKPWRQEASDQAEGFLPGLQGAPGGLASPGNLAGRLCTSPSERAQPQAPDPIRGPAHPLLQPPVGPGTEQGSRPSRILVLLTDLQLWVLSRLGASPCQLRALAPVLPPKTTLQGPLGGLFPSGRVAVRTAEDFAPQPRTPTTEISALPILIHTLKAIIPPYLSQIPPNF